MPGLKTEPDTGAGSKIPGQPQSRIGGDRSFPPDDLIDPLAELPGPEGLTF